MNRSWWFSLVAALLLLLQGCGGTASSSNPPQGSGGTTIIAGGGGTAPPPPVAPASITLTATPATVLTGGGSNGTSSVQATVRDSGGATISTATVFFTLSNNALGTITVSAVTDASGVANATFTSTLTPGTVVITGTTSGGITNTTPVTINQPATAGIQFVSATPNVVGIQGSGQVTTSTVAYSVTDVNGNAVANGTPVTFTLLGPNGGEYIGTSPGTTVLIGSTTNGQASVTLNSGSVAGPVTIRATVNIAGGGSMTASSSVISIGGGVPSATHFNLATSRFNLKGLIFSGQTATIDAFIADRFGNYNVLQGTTVSFYTEAGAIDASAVTDASGFTSVTFRTQAPMPFGPLQWTDLTAAEQTQVNDLNTTFPTLSLPTAGNAVTPRNGWVTVLATVMGEETFVDANGNGFYNLGETFTDLSEPYIDQNGNGSWDTGELYIDANLNGVFDTPNGRWDGPGCPAAGCQTSKMIWDTIDLMFTGNIASNTTYCAGVIQGGAALADSQSRTVRFVVGDQNLNRLVPGTTISITPEGAIAVAPPPASALIVPDGIGGPTQISFTISDPEPGTPAAAPVPFTITIAVTPTENVIGCFLQLNGTTL